MHTLFDNSFEQAFFDDLLACLGGVNHNLELFDLEPPKEKRQRFNKERNQLFKELQKRDGDRCQLHWNPDCTGRGTDVDHFIPLSSNVLNKQRGLKALPGKKVPTASYGSNHLNNLILACSHCNNAKKHLLPNKSQISRVFRHRNNPTDLRFSDLFNESPGWGLRGDPYLWFELRESLEFTKLPIDEASLHEGLCSSFKRLTGYPLEAGRAFHVERWNKGGMSSGMIDPSWWLDQYVPLLIFRLNSLSCETTQRKSH